jgi:cytochrome P450
MRKKCPVAHSEFLNWSLFRHEDIASVVADSETFSNVSPFPAIPNGMDPPLHGRYREALAVHFDPERIARFEPRAREIAANLLAPLLTGCEADFINSYATPFAMKTQCAFLGWPEQQGDCLADWVHENQHAASTGDHAAGKAQAVQFSKLVKANLDLHRTSSRDLKDVTDLLMNTEVDGLHLADDQIVASQRNWIAGQGTVVAGLGIVLLHVAEDLKLQDRLRMDRSLIPAAIEEILRADGPLVANRRTTTRDVEIQGRNIAKGESVTLMWIAANRDPCTFDDPDEIKIERDTSMAMVFGQGIHVCMGAPLARLEMRVALEELLARTNRFDLVGDAPRRSVYPSNGLARLSLRVSLSL